MYMIEFIVIATRYIALLLKLRITFVPFLTLHSPTELKTRCNNPVTQHESKNQTFFSLVRAHKLC